jgi:hypothetical protein
MKRDEALTIIEMIASGWPDARPFDRDEIEMYVTAIEDLDAELASHAVLKAVKDSPYRLKANELRERVRIERRALKAELPPIEPSRGRELPLWVKRWLCARMLFSQFGKDQDLRRFPEQGQFGDLTKEVMPEGAWLKEAESVQDKQFFEAFKKMLSF